MVARGFSPLSLSVTGGSALMNICRPAGSTTLAICALAGPTQNASVAIRSQAVIAVRFAIVPWGRLTNDSSYVFGAARSEPGRLVLRSRAGRDVGSVRTARNTTRLGSRLKLCPAGLLLALPWIITRARGGRGYSIGHFLGQLCLFRQPRPGRACRPRNRPPAWQVPVSACQHGL
jgi:hypothetical protein